MATTYEPIATTTLGSATSTITFSSIPSTYTDLRISFSALVSTSGNNIFLRFNGSSATNYSITSANGNGSAVAGGSSNNQSGLYLTYSSNTSTTIPTFFTIDIFSYSGSTYKTSLHTISNDLNGSGFVDRQVGLWRSTSAISSIALVNTNANLAIGTTATIYGILRA